MRFDDNASWILLKFKVTNNNLEPINAPNNAILSNIRKSSMLKSFCLALIIPYADSTIKETNASKP